MVQIVVICIPIRYVPRDGRAVFDSPHKSHFPVVLSEVFQTLVNSGMPNGSSTGKCDGQCRYDESRLMSK